MTLRDSIINDSSSIFLNANEFAEPVTYYKRGGGTRTILAVVDRDPPSIFSVEGNVIVPSFLVYIRNDYDLGISTSELDTGGDEIELPERLYELPLRKCTVIKIIDQDHGMLQLALR